MHQGALDPIHSSVWQTSYPGSDSVTHGASTTLGGESICPSSGEICPVANTTVGIARKAWIKQGLLHASLVLLTNKIIHFLWSHFLTSAAALSDWDKINYHRERERERGEEKREREREEETPLYKCRAFSRSRLLSWEGYLKVWWSVGLRMVSLLGSITWY